MKNLCQFMVALIASVLLLNSAEAQMEIRGHFFYNTQTFLRMAPNVGSQAPELCVRTLDGEPISLDSYLGKNVVVIKGSYT